MRLHIIFVLLFISFCAPIYAQNTDTSKSARFSIHSQTTVINQFKPSFKAPYTGDNSLVPQQESKTSITSTFYLGAKLWKGASVYLNPEIAGGSGLSSALGIAAATNGETFRVGSTEPKLYLARLFYKQIFAFTKETTYQADDFNQFGEYLPQTYLSVIIGKIGAADYLDHNKYSHDARAQFMSWALMDNGAWDYPANTRGYTPSVLLEYVSPKHELRYGISLLPLTANGNDMNWDLAKSNSHTLEYTHHHAIKGKSGAIRVLSFFNTTNMGSYNQSVALDPQHPVIQNTRQYGRTKYGFAINMDQDFNDVLGGFFRAGWNDGHNETWAFTEIDHSISVGLSCIGKPWQRPNDNIGLAYVRSGISKAHQAYLQAGGKGFMLGDGQLNYAWEQLVEFYYKSELVKNHLYLSGAYQFLMNPGYNRDRHGPVHIFSIRLHARI